MAKFTRADHARADALKHAYHAGYHAHGREALGDNPDNGLRDAYDQGQRDRKADDRDGTTQADGSQASGQRQVPQATRRRKAAPAPVTRAQRTGFVGGRVARSVRRSRPGRFVAKSVGSDGGGLLLVLVVYPIVLATVRYGAAGPGAWYRAKWLNQPSKGPDFRQRETQRSQHGPELTPNQIDRPPRQRRLPAPGGIVGPENGHRRRH